MKKIVVIFAAVALVAGAFSCGSSSLPNNAKDWLKKYEAMGNESVEVAKKAKSIDRSDAAAVEAHNKAGIGYQERLGKLMEEGKKIGEGLNKVQQTLFADEISKITEKIQGEKSKVMGDE